MTDYTEEIDQTKKCTALWNRVLLQLINDATYKKKHEKERNPSMERDCRDAQYWLTNRGKDFGFVCDLAGISAQAFGKKMDQLSLTGWPRHEIRALLRAFK